MTLLLPAVVPQLDTVHHCRAEDMLTALPSKYIDLIVTSPPYDNLRTYKGFSWDFEYIARQSYRVLKPGGVLVWVVGDATVDGSETLTSFKQALYFKEAVGFRMHDTMIYQRYGRYPEINRYWQEFEYMFVLTKGEPRIFHAITKQNRYAGKKLLATSRNPDGTMFDSVSKREQRTVKDAGTLGNVWFLDAGFNRSTKDAIAFEHPAIFPEKLAERHILTWSNPGDVVLDPFGGSGTTAKMARVNNRHFITCDISEEYCELMRRRLSQPYTMNMFEVA